MNAASSPNLPSTHRITFHLDRRVNARLIRSRARDRIPAARRLRAGLQLWHQDESFRAKVDQAAAGLRTSPRAEPGERGPTVKVDVSVDSDVHAALTCARGDDRLSAADRIRAVVFLWEGNPEIKEVIDARAVELGAVGALNAK